jgi:hydroxyacid-oxoacid transhydrogenase
MNRFLGQVNRVIRGPHLPGCPCCLRYAAIGPASVLPLRRRDHARLSSAAQVPGEDLKEYAFEMASSPIRFGKGATREVGADMQELGTRLVCVVSDKNIAALRESPLHTVLNSLEHYNVRYVLFTDVEIEPTDASFKAAIEFAKSHPIDAFIAVGGGSVIDTCKAANLYSTHRNADFFDFVNAPIGRGLPVPGPLKPLIAIPTTVRD